MGKMLGFTKCTLGELWLPWYLGRTRFVSVFWGKWAVQSSISSTCYICFCFVENSLKKVGFLSFKSPVFLGSYWSKTPKSRIVHKWIFYNFKNNDLRIQRCIQNPVRHARLRCSTGLWMHLWHAGQRKSPIKSLLFGSLQWLGDPRSPH